jgi:hypothetical protein
MALGSNPAETALRALQFDYWRTRLTIKPAGRLNR